MAAIGRVDGLVIDGHDTMALARFWAAMFDTDIVSIANEGEPNEAHYVDIVGNDGAPLLRFQRVPGANAVKNRLHLDMEVDGLDPAITRVEDSAVPCCNPCAARTGTTSRSRVTPKATDPA